MTSNETPQNQDPEATLVRIRELFGTEVPKHSWRNLPRRTWSFLALSVAKARTDHLTQQAAALSFITMVSLVPLLAAFSSYGTRWFGNMEADTVELLSQVLPYSEQAILAQLQVFLDQAQSIRGLGFAFFIFAALAVFTSIEETINRIWQVPGQRPLPQRLMSLALVLLCGPILIAMPHVLLYELRRSSIRSWADSLPGELLPFLITLAGLTLLYWLVPATQVRFRSALVGGSLTAVLLEVLRWGFGLYVTHATNISVIYGSFGFVLLFMVSIYVTWYLTLLGSEATYCIQHFEFMSRRRQPVAPVEGSWVGLATLSLLIHRFRHGDPITPHDVLARHLGVEVPECQRALAPLLEAGLIQENRGGAQGFLLARDPHQVDLSEIFRLYEPLQWEALGSLPEEIVGSLQNLRAEITRARRRVTDGRVLAEVVPSQPTAEEDLPTSPEPQGRKDS